VSRPNLCRPPDEQDSLPAEPARRPFFRRWPTDALLAMLSFYQRFISPLKPPCCRFHPVCSTYARQAVARHGALKGGWLALRRLARCHPFHPGGYDPAPGVDQPAGPETDEPALRSEPLLEGAQRPSAEEH
jgi:putative membrane protein insertion efficiency factor